MARLLEFDEEQAIQKAMEVFWKKGYASTSMRDLTDAMQINSSSLYNTIGDKQKLFIRCIKNYTDMRIRATEERYKEYGSPIEALENFIRDAAHIITTEPSSCLCIKATFETEGENPEIQAAVNAYDHFNHQFLQNLIEKAQNAGEISTDEDAGIIADHLGSVLIGWYNSFVLHQDSRKITDMADFVIRQLKR
ncbi:TetR/AcrR family transcriptional repressor of nem operon [Chryseobacterium sp. SORGH_AS 447]|uniref:TetR/AcrR family transcriptional regulator n=1 Tax=Chryseobacterium sp. SORGH_AS_0447 TaxID=3041769 RepID=UPI0027813EE1|nr:TetR/AcrR family transcriptional regulator [Chryseobacterium sp. SORGH_AS_0447]MDQ1161084.1 TetR/AcrR family transcriptional repressor of nem operon [Chryseobacterium sp. SORGH_AS_0447]